MITSWETDAYWERVGTVCGGTSFLHHGSCFDFPPGFGTEISAPGFEPGSHLASESPDLHTYSEQNQEYCFVKCRAIVQCQIALSSASLELAAGSVNRMQVAPQRLTDFAEYCSSTRHLDVHHTGAATMMYLSSVVLDGMDCAGTLGIPPLPRVHPFVA